MIIFFGIFAHNANLLRLQVMQRSHILLLLMLLAGAKGVHAQMDDREAEEHFKHKNYLMAIPVYKDLLKIDRDHVEYNIKLGLCYLRTNIDKTASIFYFERAYKTGKYPNDLLYYLGMAYALDYRFSDAINILNTYKIKANNKEKQAADKIIGNCNIAQTLMEDPINVSFSNLGEAFNTEYPDYYPFVSGDETFIVFNSRRKNGKNKVEEDGYYNCDIYTSSFDGERYTPGKPALGLNSNLDDQVVGISPDGDVIFTFSQAQEMYGALYLVRRNGNVFKKEKFVTSVNSDKSIETSGFLSPDGQTIFFASNRPGGFGGYDIWMVRRLPDGKWAIPQNCGPVVNTPDDEDFPTLSYDGSTLYFSSNGHEGMGGFDLFQVNWIAEDNSFVNFKNLGYPLNTPFDERTISYTIDGKHAYVSSARKGGKGDLDIYRVSFNEVEITPAIFNIKLPSGDEQNPYVTDATIIVFDQSGEAIGEYRPNNATAKFTIVLQPGVYDIEIEAPGYKPAKSQLKVNEFTMRLGVIDQEIKLEKE